MDFENNNQFVVERSSLKEHFIIPGSHRLSDNARVRLAGSASSITDSDRDFRLIIPSSALSAVKCKEPQSAQRIRKVSQRRLQNPELSFVVSIIRDVNFCPIAVMSGF